ncbi:nonribosomal siderophore peptide synthase Sid2 [Xylariales sp. PMI_506]|nr:nonribosomal siderophore peptide synthase Sid2 [Xylariales sp. PMI_506]
MGSIFVDDIHSLDRRSNGHLDLKSAGQMNGDGFRSFKVLGLAQDSASTRTGMKEEIVLLSWFIVLLRTREDSRINFEWVYKSGNDVNTDEYAIRSLSTEVVLANPQGSVEQIAAEISSHTDKVIPDLPVSSGSFSLLLSTATLSQSPEVAKDEPQGVLHIEVRFDDGRLEIRPVWHSDNILPYTVTRYVETLVDTIKLCISNPSASVDECNRPTEHDMDQIWAWNHRLPPTYDFCMHEMISERAQKHPDKEAIASWDGSLTYGQIELYSTYLAHWLRDSGVQLHDFVPVCFEKSRWTIVAVLAVMKSGATIVLMDPTLPLARLQNMAIQVGAKAMVSSRMQHDLSMSIMPEGIRFVVEEDAFAHLSESQVFSKLSTVPPSALMYIIFTSGSTGTPKGVKISHQTYTSSAIPRARAVGYTENSRVLDFASYAFDVSIDSMLLTLGNGGCLCIPSDEDRLNDINEVMRRMQVNYAGITPSVARILDREVIKSLSALGLGGEAASPSDVTLWGQDARIVIGYGPCECTIGCTVNSSAATGRDYVSIGPGNGAAMWVVNPNDHEVLMPVGAVGELLVEGPIVGQGYLNDDEKTAAAFIHDPSWLVAGHKTYPGRSGRLYKTGDLGIYDPDGTGGIVFVGRKDTQVKLRGQRVELGEIESQLNARLPSETNVIAEVIVPQGAGGQPTLVAFIAPQSAKGIDQREIESAQLSPELRSALSNADAEIAKVLPRYMVPNAYIPVNHIPTLISGKTDRKRLRAFGATVDLRQLDDNAASTANRELTDLEKRLRQAWSLTLKLDSDSIRPDDNFFALGGDSVAAMRLVSVCRERGLDLSVTSTFGNPTLAAMAEVVLICDLETPRESPTAFSMISQDVESACAEASQACGVAQSAVEDIYPCTPTQESLFTFSLKSTEVYVAQRVACIPEHITSEAWKQAWEAVVAANPILRTRVAQLQDPGLQQVILKEDIDWRYPTDLSEYLETDRVERMNLGENLARYAIVNDSANNKRYMVWTVHHVLYDGWSEPVILDQVKNVLHGKDQTGVQAQMKDFVKWVRDSDEEAGQTFWRRELKGATGPQFPRLPSRDFMPTPDAMVEREITLETSSGMPFTVATLLRGAWALVASQYTASNDVVFGETMTGRDIALPAVESILGPMVATVPIRIHVDRASSVATYMQNVQQAILSRTPYQHMGMQNIRKVSRDAQHACEAGTGLVIQPEPDFEGSELGFDVGDVVREALHFNAYPLMVAFGLRKGGFRVCASFDSSLIETAQMERIFAQLEKACVELTKDFSRRIDQISCLPEPELNQIWHWNQSPPLSFDQESQRLGVDSTTKPGAVYPRAIVPWVCNPRSPDLLSPINCPGELWLEGTFLPGDLIESPSWLVAGSSEFAGRAGNLRPTGDIVQLREDGSLVFVGRKEDVVPAQGHAVDIPDLESHFTKILPPSVSSAAAVFQSQSSDAAQQSFEQELVVFIEQLPLNEETIQLLPTQQDVQGDAVAITIADKIHTSLVVALKKLDKFVQNSLPSHMVPSAYIVVDKLPTESGDVDHNLLNQLAAKIPRDVLDQIREGLAEAWKKTSAQANLTTGETILRSSWAKLLAMTPEQIDVEDNFFRLGGDSVLAMKLVSGLRLQGHGLTVADVFQHMRLCDQAKVLKLDQGARDSKAQPYKPFSTLGPLNTESFLAEVVRPKLADPSWAIKDVLPVTHTQAMDIRGTIGTPRTSIQYTMMYFEGIYRKSLFRACTELVKTHDILRTVFIEHDSRFFQVVLNELEAAVTTHEAADKDLDEFVKDLCTTHIESGFQLGSSFLQIFHVEGKDGRDCLVLGLSHALYDGMSLPRLLRDLETLYTGGEVVDFEPFSAYVARTSDTRLQAKAVAYWSDLLRGSSLSVLEGQTTQPGDRGVFQTRSVEMPERAANDDAAAVDVTPANLLTAAWALVLARRLGRPDVTFGGVTSGRSIDMVGAESVVGPCYQLAPVRVAFQPHWTGAADLLQHVQRQSAESAAHDFLGFEEIARRCAPQWLAGTTNNSGSGSSDFDSLVHYQDHEDFDTMPFAGGTCRVDILNPHGDSPYPLKVVSFVRDGQTHVGLVGSERDAALVDTVLAELAAAVQELASGHLENVPLVA